MWRKRWWGYEHVGSDGSGSVSYHYTIGRSGIYNGCQNNWWRTVGYHLARDFDLRNYTGETQNYDEINEC